MYVEPRVQVGVAVIAFRDNKLFLGQRIGAHGANTWSLPGGKLDFGEEIVDCAARELFEESGLRAESYKIITLSNDIFKAEKLHFITIFVQAFNITGTQEVKEKEKCLEWRWVDLDNLPTPLFLPLENLIKSGFQFSSLLPN